MKVMGVVDKIGDKMIPFKSIKEFIRAKKMNLTEMDSRKVVTGAVTFVFLAGAVAVVTPIVKTHLLTSDVGDVEMVTVQEETADFLKLNTMAINYANTTLSDIYTYVQSGFPEAQKEILLFKRMELYKYKEQLTPSNPIFMPMSQNSVQKITLLLSAIEAFIDPTNPHEEDLVKLNVYTSEYKKASDNEQLLLINILDHAGMNYELMENGQIRYSYLKMNEGD